jgi:hypothetical protein
VARTVSLGVADGPPMYANLMLYVDFLTSEISLFISPDIPEALKEGDYTICLYSGSEVSSRKILFPPKLVTF